MPNRRAVVEVGTKFNSLTYLEEIPLPKGARRKARFMCDCGESVVRDFARVRNGQIKRCSQCKSRLSADARTLYKVNNIFTSMTDANASYILGLYMADGNARKGANTLSLSLQERDRKLLQDIADIVQPDKPLHYCNVNGGQNQWKLAISNKEVCDIFKEYGCAPNKTYTLKWPTKPVNLRHFVRGFMDGDGHIGRKSLDAVGTDAFILPMMSAISEELGKELPFRHYKAGNVGRIQVRFKDDRKQILDWMYEEDGLKMERKYKSYLTHYQ